MTCNKLERYDIELFQGDDKTITFRSLGDDMSPIELRGYEIVLETSEVSLQQSAEIQRYNEWSGATQYLAGDIVWFQTESYIAKLDAGGLDPALGQDPTVAVDSWDVEEPTGMFTFTFSSADTLLVSGLVFQYEVVFYPTGLLGDKITKFGGNICMQQQGVV